MASPSITPSFSGSDYVKFFGAGALAATVTHGAATPIDVVKTRIQVDDSLKSYNMVRAARQIMAREGPSALLTGFGPTAVGYLVQGGGKFAGYEFFKKRFIEAAGTRERATRRRTTIYLGASAAAELVADVALCLLEATRIRLVLSQGRYADGLVAGFARMARVEGLRGFYAGFVPLLAKQIPYAVGQFSVQEAAVEAIYRALGPERKARLTHLQSTGVELGSGIAAGAAVLSHPADTLLSAINKGAGDPRRGYHGPHVHPRARAGAQAPAAERPGPPCRHDVRPGGGAVRDLCAVQGARRRAAEHRDS
ncbi:hypothetical protein DL765_009840 [Monosporascus sp. GIB2]|nr:hypothetical protein DL765_009840 [Monosporascus sp. GIB2]